MIIKNISPYPRQLTGLGDSFLMPGEQVDLSQYSQQDRDDCVPLQEAFRKGELICIGVGRQGAPEQRLEQARERILSRGADQPLVPVFGNDRRLFEFDATGANPDERLEPVYQSERPEPVPVIERVDGIVTRDEQGVVAVHPFPEMTRRTEPEPIEVILPEQPTITPERIREIMSQRCISFRTNGQKCKRWAIRGYEYCVNHLPKDLMKEYKEKKKQHFFKQ